jgi:hypothetical protein
MMRAFYTYSLKSRIDSRVPIRGRHSSPHEPEGASLAESP